MLGSMERRRFEAGAVVIAEGDMLRELLIVDSGTADVSMSDQRGVEHHVGLASPGTSLGEMSLFTHQPAVATVRAHSTLEVHVLREADFEPLAARFPSPLPQPRRDPLAAARAHEPARDRAGAGTRHPRPRLGRAAGPRLGARVQRRVARRRPDAARPRGHVRRELRRDRACRTAARARSRARHDPGRVRAPADALADRRQRGALPLERAHPRPPPRRGGAGAARLAHDPSRRRGRDAAGRGGRARPPRLERPGARPRRRSSTCRSSRRPTGRRSSTRRSPPGRPRAACSAGSRARSRGSRSDSRSAPGASAATRTSACSTCSRAPACRSTTSRARASARSSAASTRPVGTRPRAATCSTRSATR